MSTSPSSSASSTPFVLSRASSQTSIDTLESVKSTSRPTTERLQLSTPGRTDVRNVVFVGAGYVGGPTAAVMAYNNPDITVTVVDMSEARIRSWQSKHLPFHEPNLLDIVRIARDGATMDAVLHSRHESQFFRREIATSRKPNLFFSTSCNEHIARADVVFLSVNTPTKNSGIGSGAATDLSMFESAARSVAQVAKPGAVIVEKSTVPCRTADVIRQIFEDERPGLSCEVLSNPEFLAEGTAIADLLNPARVLIGCTPTASGERAASKLAQLYASWVPASAILTIDVWSSELAKLVANAMLAQRISSINTISALCEKTGAKVESVAYAIGLDPRLGSKFLKAGLGFGGSCFKKDVLSLSYLAESMDLPEVAHYWRQVVEMNEWQCRRFVRRVIKTLNGSLRGKKIALMGFAFKRDTSDVRETQATEVVRMLLAESPREIAIFDPLCRAGDVERELSALSGRSVMQPHGVVSFSNTNPYQACSGASAVLILTDHRMFQDKRAESTAASVPASFDSGAPSPTVESEGGESADGADAVDAGVGMAAAASPDADIESWRSWQPGPEPSCPADCADCQGADGSDKQRLQMPDASLGQQQLDWTAVAQTMKKPRWVFDGRDVVHVPDLERLGFQVECIGTPSRRR